MLSLGADPQRPNARGLTALIKAAGSGNLECVKILINNAKVPLFTLDQRGRTALDWARIGNKQSCAIFLEKAMEVSERSVKLPGRSIHYLPYMYAQTEITAARDEEFGRVKTAELTRLIDRNTKYYENLTNFTLENNLPAVMALIADVPFDRKVS